MGEKLPSSDVTLKGVLQIRPMTDLVNFERVEFDAAIATAFARSQPKQKAFKWKTLPVEDVLQPINFDVSKVEKNEYRERGRYPIISQEKVFISGYTDNANPIAAANLPLVVFGDSFAPAHSARSGPSPLANSFHCFPSNSSPRSRRRGWVSAGPSSAG